MNTVELRNIILEQLMQIEDESFLRALIIIIDTKIANDIYKLTDYEKERIHLGRERMKNGETISNEDVQKEIDKMLEFSFEWEGGLRDLKETSVELQHKANQLRL